MVAHLPPSIKQLLKLRGPNALPSPPLAKLNGVLASTFRDAQSKKAETGWLVLTTCTLLTSHRHATIGHLYRFVTGTGGGPQPTHKPVNTVNAAALKSTIFVGVPRVILSLVALHEVLDDDVKNALRTQSRRIATPDNIESITKRGRALWDSIYAPHADKLHDKLGSYHPDFISFIIQSYGTVLAPLPGGLKTFSDASHIEDPDQGNLSRALGSVVGMATLRAEGKVGPQLISHTFGLLKARTIPGLSEEDRWLTTDEGTEWVIRTVDQILDIVSPEVSEGDVAKVKL
ncbi:hypothetical protein BD779DRAFT_1490375 [Infundibulicybe gibba]|nr:hypothetical protein BD779DRAFT_1490375 [Infundibulicybe gibba]